MQRRGQQFLATLRSGASLFILREELWRPGAYSYPAVSTTQHDQPYMDS